MTSKFGYFKFLSGDTNNPNYHLLEINSIFSAENLRFLHCKYCNNFRTFKQSEVTVLKNITNVT